MLNNQECQERVHCGEVRGASVCHAQRRSRSEPAVRRCEESWPHFSPTALCWGSGPQQTTCLAWRAGKRWNKNPPLLSMRHAKLPSGGHGLCWKRFEVCFLVFPHPLIFFLCLCSFPFLISSSDFHHSTIPLPTYLLTALTRLCALVCVFVCTGCLWFIVSAFRSELKSLENKWDRLIELRRQFA